MRQAFIAHMMELAAVDLHLYFIAGDVGFSFIEPFKEKYGHRFINAGIAEQNMIGVAAGLAMAGKNVYVYTIIPFLVMRCFEQIRVDLCYQNLPVKLVGVGAGYGYGELGGTHHAIEDVAIMQSLPEMSVLAPTNKQEATALFKAMNQLKSPVYCRLAKNDESAVYPATLVTEFGKMNEVFEGVDGLLITTGHLFDVGVEICNKLKAFGIYLGLATSPTIKPLDLYFFKQRSRFKAVFTLEEHTVFGGFGQALGHALLETGNAPEVFKAFAIQNEYAHVIGSPVFLRAQAGLDAVTVATKILQILKPLRKL